MPSQIVSSSGCCQPCDSDPIVVNIPGPQGEPGINGTNGVDGIDSFTYTTAQFQVPALGAWVLVFVDNSDFLPESVAGQFFVSIQGVGYMQVVSVDGLQLTLQNPAAGVLGVPNAVPTTVIPAGSLITLAGAIGPTGAPGASGGAPTGASYICRTGDGTLTNETALDLLAAGYMKTAGSGGAGVISTTATVPVADISGTLPIAKGGTNLTTAPVNKIPVGDGTTYLQKEIVGSLPIVVTNSAGNITISAPSVAGFSYVTFSSKVTSTFNAFAGTKNPFSLTSFPSATYSNLDPTSSFNNTTGKFTVPNSGYYRISCLINFKWQASTPSAIIEIRKNSSPIFTSIQFPCGTSTAEIPPVFIECTDLASTSDFYEIYIIGAAFYFEKDSMFAVQRIQA